MKVLLATPDVAAVVRESGGRLYVWTDAHRCCGGSITYLATGTKPESGRDFHHVDVEGFELFFDPGRMNPPEELLLDVKGRRMKRVEAYWNGCVFAI